MADNVIPKGSAVVALILLNCMNDSKTDLQTIVKNADWFMRQTLRKTDGKAC